MTQAFREDIACFYEGTSEKAILDMLVDAHMLVFERDQLVNETFQSMQTISQKNIEVFSETILRQVDPQDKMDIIVVADSKIVPRFSSLYQDRVGEIYIVLTKPEIEMLMIYHEGWNKEFQKVKSSTKPKEFVTQKLKKKKISY